MKVLISPMSAMAETHGSQIREAALATELLEQEHEVAFCADEDQNYRPIKNVKNYPAPVPSPFGLPAFLGKNLFALAQTLGIQQRKQVDSFEQVLFFTGNTNVRYFQADVTALLQAFSDFQPDMIYSEFRLSAIVAAKLAGLPVAASLSFPTQVSYASNPRLSQELAKWIESKSLPKISSALEIFDWADLKFVPSSFDLEPFEPSKNVIFTGPFLKQTGKVSENPRNIIVAYLGNGTISPKRAIRELTQAFKESPYEIYLAAANYPAEQIANLHIAAHFDFDELLPRAVAFINHGGQNSVMSGLLYGVPQIICPGYVFERKYNAYSLERKKAGIVLKTSDFTAENVSKALSAFENDRTYQKNAQSLGQNLQKLGGAKAVVAAMTDYLSFCQH